MSPRNTALLRAAVVSLVLAAPTACKREERRLDAPSPAPPSMFVSEGELQPGPTYVVDTARGPYDDNAAGTSEGQQLFEQMNCTGCHGNGGGSIGPALMDDQWLYGSSANQIFASIAQGRPNGMPAWKYRLTTDQIWKLVAYVRSLSSLTPKGARPDREDHMMVKPAPYQTPRAKPKQSGPPGD